MEKNFAIYNEMRAAAERVLIKVSTRLSDPTLCRILQILNAEHVAPVAHDNIDPAQGTTPAAPLVLIL